MRNMYMCYGVFDMLKAIMHTVWELFNDITFGPISISLSLSLSLSYCLMRENAQVKYAKVIQSLHPRGKLVFTTKSVVGLYAIHGPHTTSYSKQKIGLQYLQIISTLEQPQQRGRVK